MCPCSKTQRFSQKFCQMMAFLRIFLWSCRQSLISTEVRLGWRQERKELLMQQVVEPIGSYVAVLRPSKGDLFCLMRFCIIILRVFNRYDFTSFSKRNTIFAQQNLSLSGQPVTLLQTCLIMLLKIIILTLLIGLTLGICAQACGSCRQQDNPYSCLSCPNDNQNIYIFSCPQPSTGLAPFIAITVIITGMHLFMLAMGQGVYRDIFQNIQLVSLVTWRYGFERGAVALQGTNLGVVRNNSFPDTFGSEFIVVMVMLGVFWLLLIVVDRIPHSPTAILIRRKKIIFPTRVITFIFNMLLFSSMLQVTTVSTETKFKAFAFVLAILALVKIVIVLIGLLVTSNWKRFQVDDPHYYVLLEQMTTKRWYAKNNVFISLIARGIIIIAFVTLFESPQIAGIIMIITQILYSLYVIALLRYTKIRYYVFIVLGNLLTVGTLLVIYIGGIATINTDAWSNDSIGYVSMVLIMVGVFFIATMTEIITRKEVIAKQMKSIFSRFILCEKLEDKVLVSKYDQNRNKERVTEFHANLLYQKDAREEIEMSNRSNSN